MFLLNYSSSTDLFNILLFLLDNNRPRVVDWRDNKLQLNPLHRGFDKYLLSAAI